jgi:hypothetical protein
MKEPVRLTIRGYSGTGFASGLIKWFTFGEISHVSGVFEYANHPPEEFESIQGKGVCHHAPTEGKAFVAFHAPLTPDELERAFELAQSIHGKYDWAGIWGFMRRKRVHNPLKWFCAEYWAYILWKSKYPLSRREPYRETPSSICESLRITRSAEDEDPNGV